MSIMEQPGQKEPNRKRKCGPRVKTGCITCRIRRVKCDEGKPACYKCTSTGRKCDGYVQRPQEKVLALPVSSNDSSSSNALGLVAPLSMVFTMPFSMPGSPRDRQLFHFYCVQSAFDLSVYLNSSFWQNTIMQYGASNPIVRQAVIAFGASHVYAINMNQKGQRIDGVGEGYEQARQYDRALRALRTHIETSEPPDPQVILICCALFFSCENGRGNREAALQHLHNGLQIINTIRRKQITDQPISPSTDPAGPDVSAIYEGSVNKLRSKEHEVDDELLYVFSRLDCQATLCQEERVPVLDMNSFGEPVAGQNTRFVSITDAQRKLDVLHNRLAMFLTNPAVRKGERPELSLPWILERKVELERSCVVWAEAMNNFIAAQAPTVRKTLASERAGTERTDPEWKLAVQIQLLVLHHRCWWMLFLSSYPNDPTVFTMSPNPRANEILDICEFLGFSLPLRPSVHPSMSDADMMWKLISEIGVAAPLFVLATKCADPIVQDRAWKQLTALREHRNGVYDQKFLGMVINNLDKHTDVSNEARVTWDGLASMMDSPEQSASPGQDDTYRSPQSDSGSSQDTGTTTMDGSLREYPSRELLGWSRRLHNN